MEENIKQEQIKQKFHPGDAVIIQSNLMGAILNGYLWSMKDTRKYLYRVLVDANDCVYRIKNNSIDQTRDKDIFAEDYNTLMWHTEQIAVMEIFEEDIIKYEI